jgi:hypothetical protein
VLRRTMGAQALTIRGGSLGIGDDTHDTRRVDSLGFTGYRQARKHLEIPHLRGIRWGYATILNPARLPIPPLSHPCIVVMEV